MWKSIFKRPVKKPVSVTARVPAPAIECLEERRLMSTYSYTVEVDPYAVGITSAHDTGSSGLAATAVTITADTAPTLETVLRTALGQAGVTLAAQHTTTLSGTYSSTGPSSSNRLLFLPASQTGSSYPGTTSHEQSLATAKGLTSKYVVAFEDGTDFDYNDGYFLVNIASV